MGAPIIHTPTLYLLKLNSKMLCYLISSFHVIVVEFSFRFSYSCFVVRSLTLDQAVSVLKTQLVPFFQGCQARRIHSDTWETVTQIAAASSVSSVFQLRIYRLIHSAVLASRWLHRLSGGWQPGPVPLRPTAVTLTDLQTSLSLLATGDSTQLVASRLVMFL